jgi:hypothetical protein
MRLQCRRCRATVQASLARLQAAGAVRLAGVPWRFGRGGALLPTELPPFQPLSELYFGGAGGARALARCVPGLPQLVEALPAAPGSASLIDTLKADISSALRQLMLARKTSMDLGRASQGCVPRDPAPPARARLSPPHALA